MRERAKIAAITVRMMAIITKGFTSILFFTKKKVHSDQKKTTNNSGKIKGVFDSPLDHVFTFLTKNKDQERKDIVIIIAVPTKTTVLSKLSG